MRDIREACSNAGQEEIVLLLKRKGLMKEPRPKSTIYFVSQLCRKPHFTFFGLIRICLFVSTHLLEDSGTRQFLYQCERSCRQTKGQLVHMVIVPFPLPLDAQKRWDDTLKL